MSASAQARGPEDEAGMPFVSGDAQVRGPEDEAGVPCALLRGGTSKAAYFLARDLPRDPRERDDLLLRIMGSGHPLQIDGIGGAHSLASKVAVVSPSKDDAADVDYLFLQLGVERATVTDLQNCGNVLAGVGPFVVERGLVPAGRETTAVRVRMVNSGSVVTATFATPAGVVRYRGDTHIAGAPGTASPITLRFSDTAGSATGSLLPTGRAVDVIDGTEVTCVDNGMPVVVARAADLGITGYESHEDLAADASLRERVERLRLAAGRLMGLGDVAGMTVPKTTLVASPRDGGTICTRTFIPSHPHTAIGVLGALSAASALLLPGGVGAELAELSGSVIDVEHPTGHLLIDLELDTASSPPAVLSAGVIRTARKLFDGTVYPSASHPTPPE
ncbi:4-oxalomesaconate tautomerase [Streptosporangium sp. 'caverna']|uniref:4-oxalomesaconate tautomerase n=1 Tax=Streptosporangium sp. 'caverna' TaxID=2202249 RepID=UPI001EF97C51|nr:4-oxalomesaconate tautomerase [Streptosporangium sp. 'caverna']